MTDWWSQLFDFSDYDQLLWLLRNSILAGVVLGLVGGLVGVFVMSRDLAFAVHGVSELSFAGAAAGLLSGVGVVSGSIAGSLSASASASSSSPYTPGAPPRSSGCSPGRSSRSTTRAWVCSRSSAASSCWDSGCSGVR
jgi:hypothetical protein